MRPMQLWFAMAGDDIGVLKQALNRHEIRLTHDGGMQYSVHALGVKRCVPTRVDMDEGEIAEAVLAQYKKG